MTAALLPKSQCLVETEDLCPSNLGNGSHRSLALSSRDSSLCQKQSPCSTDAVGIFSVWNAPQGDMA